MYNRIQRNFFLAAAVLFSANVSATDAENFNSRKGVPLRQLKSSLQNSCWTFHHFDINQNGWNPAIEGDGAMVSSKLALKSGNAGIYTPLLTVDDKITVSFNYTFNQDFGVEENRWLKICLADAGNKIIQVLEQIELNGFQATRIQKFSTEYKNITAGEYRFLLLYGGSGGEAQIAIDQLTTSAPYKYADGCNSAPIVSDISIKGEADRTAKGVLISSEIAASQKIFLVKNAEQGRVELFPDGTFVFTPHNGFKGRTASFTYRLCDGDGSNLCSEPVIVRINFPGEHLAKFHGSYKYNGNVELAWLTTADSNVSRFDVERSTDGKKWTSAGTVYARNVSTNGNDYTYLDKVGKNTALKKDLYYRLRQIDTDGEVKTSNPMIVRVYNKKALTMICVAPNPIKREIAVNVQLVENSMVTFRLFDHTNSTIIHRSVQADAGINNLVVEGSRNLAAGNYMLEVIVNSKERMLVKLTRE